ncbi:MAG: TetR/AcrR family transcriptional regulator [Anaeroplasmataceae bacterium]
MKKEYRNVIKTKKAIREAFADLVSEKKDIHKITVTELIERADIAKSTFYLHYQDIYDVAQEFEQEILNTLSNIISNTISTIDSFENSFDLALKLIKDNEQLYSKIVNSSEPMYFIEKLKHVLVQRVFNKISLPFFSSDPKIKNAQIRFFANGTVDLVIDYLKGNLNISLEECKSIILSFIYNR